MSQGCRREYQEFMATIVSIQSLHPHNGVVIFSTPCKALYWDSFPQGYGAPARSLVAVESQQKPCGNSTQNYRADITCRHYNIMATRDYCQVGCPWLLEMGSGFEYTTQSQVLGSGWLDDTTYFQKSWTTNSVLQCTRPTLFPPADEDVTLPPPIQLRPIKWLQQSTLRWKKTAHSPEQCQRC